MLEEEITAEKLKEMLLNWFTEKENKQTLRTFVRSFILNKLIKQEEQLKFKLMKNNLDNIDIALVYFVCDYLAQNNFHYSLSVFSSEISSTRCKEYVCDYFNKISYKWNTKKPPMLEYYSVHNVLSTLNIDSSSSVGSDIINRYYLLCEGSLLKVIASVMRCCNSERETHLADYHQDNSKVQSKSTMSPEETFHFEEVLEKYLLKKELQIKRGMSSQKQEFYRCKRILLSCHDALVTKLNEIYQLMEHINSQKNEIAQKLQIIENNYIKSKLPVEENLITDSQLKKVEQADKIVMVREIINVKDNFTQSKKLIFIDKGTETINTNSINVSSQTDHQEDSSDLVRWQIEKLELLEFINQQEGRIKNLTEKAMELMNKITSQQSHLPEENKSFDNVQFSLFNNPQVGLEEIIYQTEQSINKFHSNFESIKKKSLETEKSYSNFLDTVLNS